MTGQLVLDFGAPAAGRFEDFWPGNNQQVLASLLHLAQRGGYGFFALWGEPGAGKSHLAHALCEEYSRLGRSVILVDGQQRPYLRPAMLEGLAEVDLVLVDDIDVFAADPEWEEALFHLYNQLQQAGSAWVVTLAMAPLHSPFRLPDLKSRLCACETYRIQPLSENDKKEWMRQMAYRRGFELEPEWCDYILNRSARHLPALTAVIDALDRASLSAQRTITLPFIRQVMGW